MSAGGNVRHIARAGTPRDKRSPRHPGTNIKTQIRAPDRRSIAVKQLTTFSSSAAGEADAAQCQTRRQYAFRTGAAAPAEPRPCAKWSPVCDLLRTPTQTFNSQNRFGLTRARALQFLKRPRCQPKLRYKGQVAVRHRGRHGRSTGFCGAILANPCFGTLIARGDGIRTPSAQYPPSARIREVESRNYWTERA